MKKNLCKALCLVMASLMLCGTANAVSARSNISNAENEVQLRFEEIRGFIANLSIGSFGAAHCTSRAQVADSSYRVELFVELQQFDSGWDTVKDWSATGTLSASVSGTWYVASGYDYQVKATATVYNSSGREVESETIYSDIMSY